MARMGMVFDLKACIGCNACVVACKQENSLPDGVFFTRTLSHECARRPNFDHPCRLNIDQGWKPVSIEADCG